MSDSVVTANETGGWHRVRSILSTASEDEDHIAFNNDHIKHDMNENEKSAGVTGEEHLDRDTVNDDADNVDTAKEVDGRLRGRLVLRIVNEENDFTVFYNGFAEHSTDDGMGETKKIKHNQEEVKAHPQKPRRLSPWRLQGSQVMNIPIETQQKWKQIASRVMVTTLGSHTWSLRQVLSCYMLATTWTKFKKYDEDSEDGEEEGETAANENEEISEEDVEIRRLIEFRRSTPKEEKQQLEEVSKFKKGMYQRQKRETTARQPRETRKLQRCQQHPILIKSAKKKVHITKVKNKRGEIITSRKGIANVFGDFYKQLYDDNEQEESEQEIGENENESSIDV